MRGFFITLGVGGAAVLFVAIAGWGYLNYTQTVWEGERNFTVTETPDPDYTWSNYWVESSDAKPQEAAVKSVSGYLARTDVPAGVDIGDQLECSVRETFTLNTDIANGPQAHVINCRR